MGQKQNPDILAAGTLVKTGQAFEIRHQGPQDIDAILGLQNTVLQDLSEEEQSYVIPKDRAFFEKHFAQGNIVLGVFVEGRLIAQSVIVNPTKQNPKTGMTDMPGRLDPARVTVIQGVVVHPDMRGNRLMTEMVDVWLDIARKQGRRHAIAEVTAENHFSWSVFMKEGLQLHSIGYDPEDAVYLFNMHAKVKHLINARLQPTFNAAAKRGPKTVACHQADIEGQKSLLRQGFRGVARDGGAGQILFEKPKKKGLVTVIKENLPKCFR